MCESWVREVPVHASVAWYNQAPKKKAAELAIFLTANDTPRLTEFPVDRIDWKVGTKDETKKGLSVRKHYSMENSDIQPPLETVQIRLTILIPRLYFSMPSSSL